MWRMTPRLAIATLTATLALAVAHAPKADAAATYSYTTTGSVSGMSGSVPIQFFGLSGTGSLTTPGAFTLGEFVTNPLPPTGTLTYDHTPFTIDVVVHDATNYYNTDYKITGELNGSITGAGFSDMLATATSVTAVAGGVSGIPPFPASDLAIVAPQAINAPDGSGAGFTTLTGQVLISGLGPPSPTPEPTSIAVFGAALGGWLIRRRSRSKAIS